MKYWLALAALAAATPARADDFANRQRVYHALNAIDAAQTCHILGKGGRELNPILGSHPSCMNVVTFKLASSMAHEFIARKLNERDSDAARVFQIISIGIQGGVVAANFRFVF